MKGDVWAVEELTEIRKRVQLIQYKWRDTELLLSFYGLHTAATATEFCFRGFAVLGFSWVGQLGYFENDVALLTAIHLTTANELFSISPKKVMDLLSPLFPLPGILENLPKSTLFHSPYNFEIIGSTCISKLCDTSIACYKADSESGPLWDTGQGRIIHWPATGQFAISSSLLSDFT